MYPTDQLLDFTLNLDYDQVKITLENYSSILFIQNDNLDRIWVSLDGLNLFSIPANENVYFKKISIREFWIKNDYGNQNISIVVNSNDNYTTSNSDIFINWLWGSIDVFFNELIYEFNLYD